MALTGWLLLDKYRDRIFLASGAGALLAFLMSYLLIRQSLRPLRDIARSAADFIRPKILSARIAVCKGCRV